MIDLATRAFLEAQRRRKKRRRRAQDDGPDNVTTFRFASNRQRMMTVQGSAIVENTQYMACSLVFWSPGYEQTNVRICIPNFYIDQTGGSSPEKAPLNARLIEGAAIEIGGVKTPFTFNGSLGGFEFTDEPYVWSDPCEVTIPANSSFKIIIADYVAIGGYRVAGYRPSNGHGDRYTYGATSQAAFLSSGTPATPTSGVYAMGPCAIIAEGAVDAGVKVPCVFGDSIAFGLNEDTRASDARGNYGFVGRGLDSADGGRMPFGMFAIPGTRLSNLADTPGEFAIRAQLLRDVKFPFDTALSEMGVNSVGGGWPQIGEDFDASAIFLRSLGNRRVVWTGLSPRSSETGNSGFSTVAGQTVDAASALGGQRWLLNDRIKASDLIDGFVDVTPYWVDDAAEDKWPELERESALEVAVSSGTSLSVSGTPPIIGDSIVIGADASGKIYREVTNVTGSGPYTVTLRTAVTGGEKPVGAVVRATPTTDGVHPSTALHVEAAQAIIDAKAVIAGD